MSENTSPCFVAQMDLNLADKLKNDLLSQGFELSHPPYTILQAKKKGISLTLYSSGKITVQGKDKHEFLSFYLEPEILHNLTYSYPLQHVDLKPRIGIDEAGKGDYFGPLCIGGLYVNGEGDIKELSKMGVKDSKQLSDTTIIKLSHELKKKFQTAVIRVFPKRYNEMYASFHNLNKLLAWGHATAIEKLSTSTGCLNIIIDQFADEWVVQKALEKKLSEFHLTQRHKGEQDPVVAGASILARAAFVEGLEEMEKKFGLSLPKGVSEGVKKAARKAIEVHGVDILNEIAKMHFKTTQELL